MDAKKMKTVLRLMEDATDRTIGYTHKRALLIEEELNRLCRLYAQAHLAGAVSDKYAPENLMDHARAMIGVCGMRDKVSDVDYASAMVQWHINSLTEDGRRGDD